MSLRWRLAALLVAVTATGCLQSSTTVVVNDDGSGTADIEVAVDSATVADQAASTPLPLPPGLVPTDAAGVCRAVSQAVELLSLPTGATHEAFQEGNRCGERLHLDFADPTALTIAFNTLSGGNEAEILRQDDDRWLFDAPLVEPLDLAPTGSALPPAVIDQIRQQRTLTYEVTLPGTAVGSSTADRARGGTFTWTIAPDDTRRRLVAVTATDGGSGGLPLPALIGGGAALAALAALAGSVLARGRRRRSAPGAGAFTDAAPGAQPLPTIQPVPAAQPAPTIQPVPAAQPASDEPRWDPTRRAWVADHPVEGLVVYDDATGIWHRA